MCHICEEKIQTCFDPDGNEYTSLSEIKGDMERYRKKGEEEDPKMYKIAKKAFKQFKVRDHDHYTGKFSGAAHNSCNLAYNFKNYRLPIFFHNQKGYDEHFIVRMMGKYSNTPSNGRRWGNEMGRKEDGLYTKYSRVIHVIVVITYRVQRQPWIHVISPVIISRFLVQFV